jgi:hypothetical protein
MYHIQHEVFYPSDDKVEQHGNQACNRRSADNPDRCLPALCDQPKDQGNENEGNYAAANILPAQPDYWRINIKAGSTGSVQEEVPGNPAYKRCNASHSKTASASSPRPNSQNSRGQHTSYYSRNIRYRHGIHPYSFPLLIFSWG